MIRRTAVIATVLAVLLTASTAFAASITFSSKHLAAAALAVPVFYPNSLVTANVSTLNRARQNDTLTVVFSAEMLASTMCTGAPTQFPTLSVPLTVTITSNAAPSGNDQLALLAVGTGTCAVDGIVHFGTVDLGSTAYVASGTASFANSTFALTQTATSATIVITLGTASGATTSVVSSGTSAIYTPDPALTDTAGNGIRVSTAASTATLQF